MAEISINTLAKELSISVEVLRVKLKEASINIPDNSESLSDVDKKKLIEHLKNSSNSKLFFTSREKSKVSRYDASGNSHVVNVEIKRKRVFFKKNLEKEDLVIESTEPKVVEEKLLIKTELGAVEETSKSISTVETQLLTDKNEAVVSKKEVLPVKHEVSNKENKAHRHTPVNTFNKYGNKKNSSNFKGSHSKSSSNNKYIFKQKYSESNNNHIHSEDHKIKEIVIPESITLSDLAHKLSLKVSVLIKALMKMGVMATINTDIDQDTGMLLVEELGYKAKAFTGYQDEIYLQKTYSFNMEEENMEPRPPVVTIMGHVDHGKTTLLDYIKHSNVAGSEAGGITQHTAAYSVETKSGNITFIDTPGHEAFSLMRARGAKVTDIIILVVAADDGVKVQTIEAIEHAKDAKVPIIVAINKIDREPKVDRVKSELSAHGIISEDMGGENLFVEISAKTGFGVDSLLETISLQAEMITLKASYTAYPKGVVLESRIDRGRGCISHLLVQHGVLKKGDIVLSDTSYGKVKVIYNEFKKSIVSAGPSTPVEIQGLPEVSGAGAEFIVIKDEKTAKDILSRRKKSKVIRDIKRPIHPTTMEGLLECMSATGAKELALIIKADVHGSQEALMHALESIDSKEINTKIIRSGVGVVTGNDVSLAATSRARIICFNTVIDSTAKKMADNLDVKVISSKIIYYIIEEVKSILSSMLEPERIEKITGHAEVRQMFKISKSNNSILGCFITDGILKRNSLIRILRNGKNIFQGTLTSIRRFKEDVKEIKIGFECGLSIDKFSDGVEGDIIEAYMIQEIARVI